MVVEPGRRCCLQYYATRTPIEPPALAAVVVAAAVDVVEHDFDTFQSTTVGTSNSWTQVHPETIRWESAGTFVKRWTPNQT